MKVIQWIRSWPRGIPLMFFNILLMYAGFYAIIPFLTFYLTHDLLWTTTMAGLLLLTRQLSQQGVTLLTGMLADRVGYRLMLTLGMAIRGVGFSMFGLFDHPALLFAAAMIAGLGGSMFEPARDAACTALTPEQERGRMFAAKKLVGNLGIAVSALIAGLLLNFDFRVLSFACGGIYFFTSVLTYVRLPRIHVQITPVPLKAMLGTVFQDRTFVRFTLIICGYYFMYMQTFLAIPMQAIALTGTAQAVTLVNLVLAAVIIFGQVPISRLMRRFELMPGIRIGLILMAAGLIVLGTTDSLAVFIFGFMLFACGEMIVEPANNELISKLAKREVTATYFGFASLALAAGGGLSQGAGGYLVQSGQELGLPSLVWWVSAGIGLVAMFSLARLEKRIKGNKAGIRSIRNV